LSCVDKEMFYEGKKKKCLRSIEF